MKAAIHTGKTEEGRFWYMIFLNGDQEIYGECDSEKQAIEEGYAELRSVLTDLIGKEKP